MNTPHQHFQDIADRYDYWKEKNAYYYENIRRMLREHVPAHVRVVEIGTATGDILASLKPSAGLGIDVSEGMVAIARSKHANEPNLRFAAMDIAERREPFDTDWIVIVDVLEHVPDLPAFMRDLARLTPMNARVFVSVANPLWEPVLMLTEKLGMKMPEGPHWRLSVRENEEIFRSAGFRIAEKGYRLLVPKRIPGSDWLNERFWRWPMLPRLGWVVYWVIEQ